MLLKDLILNHLKENQNQSFTIGDLARRLNKDRSNIGKAVRKLGKENKIDYKAGVGKKGSLIIHKQTQSTSLTSLPTSLTSLIDEKQPHLETVKKEVIEPKVEKIKPTRKPRVIKPKEPSITKNKLLNMLDYDIWMNQYKTDNELKNLESAKDLHQKLNVKGNPKFREINNERGKRFVRYVLNITKAMIKKE